MKSEPGRTLLLLRDSLQFRVAVSLTLFVAIVLSLVMLGLFTVKDRVKNDLLDAIVANEMQQMVSGYPRRGAEAIPHTSKLSGFVISAGQRGRLPGPLRNLGPNVAGVTRTIHHRTYRVGTHEIGDKQGYIIYDITTIESRDSILKLVAIVIALLILGLATPLGIWIARISLKPINRLADEVASLDPRGRSTRLAEQFEHYEVGVIARAFDRFMGRLEEYVERERSFTADASHELRTPLAVIQGAVEVLQQDPKLAGSRPLTRIDRASHQMAELIESLLFLARDEQIESDRTLLCHADEVITEVIAGYRSLAAGKHLNTGRIEPCEVAAPRIALVIVLGNLLRNALRHGGDNIRVSLVNHKLAVMDDGGDMDSDELQHAFERGYRSGPGAGLGLGLYLVKRVADRYHWPLRLTSNPEEGTRVELDLARGDSL